MLKLFILILLSPTTNVDKIKTIYELSRCEEVRITCAIVIFETGNLQSYKLKVDNAQKHGNIFGFYYKKKYLCFDSYASSVRYYQRLQRRKWMPYKKKYPEKDYYQFLTDLPYCNKMETYIKTIKQLK